MATKLKNLKVKKVDFVDDGANPDAHIMLFKNKDGKPTEADLKPTALPDEGILKKVISAVCKALGRDIEMEGILGTVQKGEAETFGQKMNEVVNRKINDEIWDICYALQSSFWSIMNDEEVQNRLEVMQQSLQEFIGVMEGAVVNWAAGKSIGAIQKSTRQPSLDEINIMKSSREKLEEMIAKAEAAVDAAIKEGEKEMGIKIDKSKMTPAERAFFEDLEKRYGDEGAAVGEGAVTPPEGNQVGKSAAVPASTSVGTPAVVIDPATVVSDSVIKSLQAQLENQLEIAKKHNDAIEEAQLMEVAKKYEDIQKPEELLSVLKSLKAAGEESYNAMITSLDSTLNIIKTSDMFGEVGKRGVQAGAVVGIEKKLDDQAQKLRKSRPELSIYEARDIILAGDQELREQYENS